VKNNSLNMSDFATGGTFLISIPVEELSRIDFINSAIRGLYN